jgi:hypothetical protein
MGRLAPLSAPTRLAEGFAGPVGVTLATRLPGRSWGRSGPSAPRPAMRRSTAVHTLAAIGSLTG